MAPRRSNRLRARAARDAAEELQRQKDAWTHKLLDQLDQGTYMQQPLPTNEAGITTVALRKILIRVAENLRALRQAQRRAQFEPSFLIPHDLNPTRGLTWRRRGFLGGGAFGLLFSFDSIDADGDVVDRVVVKDCHVEDTVQCNMNQWSGVLRDPNRRQHIEIGSLLRINGFQDIVTNNTQLLRAKIHVPKQQHTIIMEECPYGDLHDTAHLNHVEEGIFAPEPVVWAIAYNMLRALHQLRHGTSELDQHKPGWSKEIVHRDVKLANIFIADEPTQGAFQAYPRFVLGDFGWSAHTSVNDKLNPLAFADGAGTPNEQAPEQLAYMHSTTFDMYRHGQLSEKTNIWALGHILMSVMSSRIIDHDFDSGPRSTRITDPVVINNYSDKLLRFVNWMLRSEPARRPTVRKAFWTLLRRCDYGNADEEDDNDDDDSDGDNDNPRPPRLPIERWPADQNRRRGPRDADSTPAPDSESDSDDDNNVNDPARGYFHFRGEIAPNDAAYFHRRPDLVAALLPLARVINTTHRLDEPSIPVQVPDGGQGQASDASHTPQRQSSSTPEWQPGDRRYRSSDHRSHDSSDGRRSIGNTQGDRARASDDSNPRQHSDINIDLNAFAPNQQYR